MDPDTDPDTDMDRGIITAQVTDIDPIITGRTVITITVHIAIQDTGITKETGTMGGAIPGATIENTGPTDMLVIITGVTGNITGTIVATVAIIKIDDTKRHAKASGV